MATAVDAHVPEDVAVPEIIGDSAELPVAEEFTIPDKIEGAGAGEEGIELDVEEDIIDFAGEGLTTAERLRWWYSTRRPLTVDIVGDFAGHELFVVHGESLIRDCLGRGQVDIEDGFQLLHAIYEAEKFLDQLRRRNCNFHVVFFDSHDFLAAPSSVKAENVPKALLIRKILIAHLKRSMVGSEHVIAHLASPEDKGFARYLEENAVQFFFVYDGDADASHQDQHTVGLRRFMYGLASIGYSIGFLKDTMFMSSKVFVPIMSGSSEPLPAVEPASPRVKHEASSKVADIGEIAAIDGLTARDIVLVGAIREYAAQHGQPDSQHVLALVVQSLALRSCSLSDRRCAPVKLDDDKAADFLQKICTIASDIVTDDALETPGLTWDLYDLIDGRIFGSIVGQLASQKPLPDSISSEAKRLFEIALGPDGPSAWESLGTSFAPVSDKVESDVVKQSIPTVLPFNHPVMDEFLRDLNLAHTTEKSGLSSANHQIFEDLPHWHNQKPVARKLAPAPGFFARKRKQKFMSDIMAYAASLTDSVGKVINPEVVIVKGHTAKAAPLKKVESKKPEPKKQESKKPEPKKIEPKGGKKGAVKKGREGTGKDAALSAAKTLADQAAHKKEQSVTRGWETSLKELDQQTDLVRRYINALKFFQSLSKESQGIVGPDVCLYLCNILVQQWNKAEQNNRKSLGIVGAIWNLVLSMSSFTSYSPDVISGLKTLTSQLALPPPPLTGSPSSPRPLAFTLAPKIQRIPQNPIPFQLEHGGPYLSRSFDSQPDPRVPFSPDAWQRRVLDGIDDDKSIFVVAPTSAGKTFISFYAMKQILQRDDDGVIVYVAPTKALVNQIAAEIVARFTKSYNTAGRCLWALKTRDYTINDPAQAQILITVPHMLQIMLMSGGNASRPSSWSRRVKRIIFDEVHCIGQAEDGVVWEQLLLMAPCPIIALSATVGNAAAFSEWLAGTQKVRGHELEMVTHNVRYSELRKFTYTQQKTDKFTGLEKVTKIPMPGLDEGEAPNPAFQFVHPLAALTDRTRANLNDITLEPRDCLTLWELMVKHQTAEFPADKSLDPEKCLPRIVSKADYVSWEHALKEAFCKWMHDAKSPYPIVLSALRGSGLSGTKRMGENTENLFPMLRDLHSQDALPVLVFNYDRHLCERRARIVALQLEGAENAYKESSAAWQKKVRRYNEWKKEKESKKAQPSKSRAPVGKQDGEKVSKLDQAREDGSADFSEWELFDPTAPLEQFTFADVKKMLPSEFRDMVKPLVDEEITPWLIDALRRGLGVHHAGMNRRYRSVLEILFRRGYVRVVIATGTLALGINMPCKTVVFDDKSLYLTALNYRQASGRAGRRGFDLLGNIVFFGHAKDRAYEIMSSRLPDLIGQFSLSTTLILRLLILLQDTNNGEYASRATKALLSQSRLFLGGPEAEGAIRHHLRFSLDYLRRQHLVSATGSPLNFAGLVSHLYFVENSAFALHALFKGGYFHEVCADIDSRPQEVVRELMLVLSHLFGRVPVQRTDKDYFENTVKRSASVVLLPALPDKAHSVLKGHNIDTLNIFKNYVQSYAEHNLADKPESKLPFSRQDIGQSTGGADVSGLFPSLPPTVIRSPFVALSGHDDEFTSIRDLCQTVRSDVFLEESAVPHVSLWPEDDARPINAYLYDFFKHGSLTVLVRDNRIKAGDVWFLLRDFQLVLMTIVTSLRNFVGADKTGEGDEDEDAGDEWSPEMARGMGREGAGGGQPADKENFQPTHGQGQQALPIRAVRKKQKVSDSWEDDMSEGAESEEDDEGNAGGEDGDVPAWQQEGRGGLMKVLQAFEALLEEFETTFRKVWA
jgi:hypothetical protein